MAMFLADERSRHICHFGPTTKNLQSPRENLDGIRSTELLLPGALAVFFRLSLLFRCTSFHGFLFALAVEAQFLGGINLVPLEILEKSFIGQIKGMGMLPVVVNDLA
jgi:hypothetical protein